MNVLLMNRDGFVTPADGWYQIAPVGEFPHAQAGLTQVVDAEACQAMANRFTEEAKAPNFAGLLVDFDHFSLDGEKKSEAAGWITALENRADGLYAKIRWSDVGDAAVKGGRYRFLSPVWNRADCVNLGGGRVRPVRLLNAAVTNDPNFKGMAPLSNRGQSSDVSGQNGEVSTATDAKGREGGEQRFKWTLGNTEKGHCPSCAAMTGQVHTMPEWEISGVTPGSAALFCKGACKCSLEPTDEASMGPVAPGPMRTVANTGWTDAARAASLAVRQARATYRGRPARPWARSAKDRAADRAANSPDVQAHDRGSDRAADDAAAEQAAQDEADQLAHEKAADEKEHQDTPADDADQLAHEKAADEKEHQDTPDPADATKGGEVVPPPQDVKEPLPPPPISKGDNPALTPPEKAPQAPKAGHSPKAGSASSTGSVASAKQAASLDAASADVAAKYEQVGLAGLTSTETNTMTARITRKVTNGTALTPTEKSFLTDVGAKVAVKNRVPGVDMEAVRGQVREAIRAARATVVAG